MSLTSGDRARGLLSARAGAPVVDEGITEELDAAGPHDDDAGWLVTAGLLDDEGG